MGRLTSGDYNIYGRGSEQIDLAKQNRINNPNGGHTTLGVLGATLIPNLLSGAISYVADPNHSGGGGKSVKKVDTEATPETLKQELDAKLAEVKCSDTDAVRAELSQQQAKLLDLDKAVNKANLIITNLNDDIAEAEGVLNNAQGEITALEELKANNSPEFDAARYEYLTQTLPAQIEKAKNEQLPAAQAQLEEAQKLQEPVTARITELQSALKYIEPREKQLNELESKNTVDQFKNDEAENILSLINNIKEETNSTKVAELKKELDTAIEAYYAKHKLGYNKTIDRFAASQGQFNNVIGPMPEWIQEDELKERKDIFSFGI